MMYPFLLSRITAVWKCILLRYGVIPRCLDLDNTMDRAQTIAGRSRNNTMNRAAVLRR